MSKKHFIALARKLHEAKPEAAQVMLTQAEITQWRRDVKAVADVCSDSNPAFDYHRFLDACGYQS